jgi:chaperonin cofactor prefoldin
LSGEVLVIDKKKEPMPKKTSYLEKLEKEVNEKIEKMKRECYGRG